LEKRKMEGKKMVDTDDLNLAQKVYKTICDALDHADLKYQRDDEKLSIESSMQGDDLPMRFLIFVAPERQIFTLYSPLPLRVPEEMRSQMAAAVCAANQGMICGSFDFDGRDGAIVYRMSEVFSESIISEQAAMFIVIASLKSIDRYNDRFFMMSKGKMSLEEFLEEEYKGQ
jgi:hypothetical protein